MFRIGEFSKIAQVSGRLLRYYDAIGLFRPVRIDAETGYRFYSVSQLPELNRILALKELGLTLNQIQQLLAGQVSTDEIRGMLVMKKAQIEQTLREEMTRIRYIESRINQIDQDGQMGEAEVVLKSVPAARLLATRETSTTLAACRAAAQAIGRMLLGRIPTRIGRKALGNFTLIIHSELWETDDMDVEIGFLLNTAAELTLSLQDDRVMQTRALPAVAQMATTIHRGIPETGHRSYTALGNWAEANAYHFAGPSREVFIQLPHEEDDGDVIVEVQVPVERGKQGSGSQKDDKP